MFENCVYDSTGAVLCTYRGYPFQCSEMETPDEWASLQALVGADQLIIAPYVAPPAPTAEEQEELDAADARVERDALLAGSDWLVNRHRDQRDSGAETTLTNAQYVAVLTYRTALRDISSQAGWPGDISWPPLPEFVGNEN